jgi:hypothetical protein
VRELSAERIIRKLGRTQPETLADTRKRVINFLRDW